MPERLGIAGVVGRAHSPERKNRREVGPGFRGQGSRRRLRGGGLFLRGRGQLERLEFGLRRRVVNPGALPHLVNPAPLFDGLVGEAHFFVGEGHFGDHQAVTRGERLGFAQPGHRRGGVAPVAQSFGKGDQFVDARFESHFPAHRRGRFGEPGQQRFFRIGGRVIIRRCRGLGLGGRGRGRCQRAGGGGCRRDNLGGGRWFRRMTQMPAQDGDFRRGQRSQKGHRRQKRPANGRAWRGQNRGHRGERAQTRHGFPCCQRSSGLIPWRVCLRGIGDVFPPSPILPAFDGERSPRQEPSARRASSYVAQGHSTGH